jgi:hypothetical protein
MKPGSHPVRLAFLFNSSQFLVLGIKGACPVQEQRLLTHNTKLSPLLDGIEEIGTTRKSISGLGDASGTFSHKNEFSVVLILNMSKSGCLSS